VSLEADVAELRARLSLAEGTATLLLAVVPSDAVLEEVKRPLLELLRATPLAVVDLGACTSSMGPARWAELTRARVAAAAAGVHVLSFVPATALEARTFANLLNAQRGLLRELAGPVLLVVSGETERVLRRHAHDFVTWVAQGYALPEPRELLAMASRLGVAAAQAFVAPPPEPPIRFLHVSDFHLRPARVSRYEQDRVLDGLLGFLERDRAGFPLDLVFVTGDLAWSGKAAEYVLVVDLLRKLLEATGVPPERLFVVPGNHDVDRGVGRWLLRTLAGDDEAIAFFEEPDGRTFHRRKLEAYEASLRELLGPERSLGLHVGAEAVELVEVAGTRLAVASFNSSWFSQGDGDQGKLWIGEPNIRGALGRIADADAAFAISLVHHPFEYLHEGERELIESWFERGFDLVLRGHLHKNKTRSIASQRGGYVEVAAPASYQGSQWPNGCFLGEIRAKARTVRLRPYAFASGPDPWVLDTKVFPDDAIDGHCHTFVIPARHRRKSGMSSAAMVAVKNAYEKATPYQKKQVQRQVLGDRAGVADPRAEHETVTTLAAESPELRATILGKEDSGIMLVSAIESESLAITPSAPRIDVTEAAGFERALASAGRLFLEHTAKLKLQRSRMSERDATVGFAAALGAVIEAPIDVDSMVGGLWRGIVIGQADVPGAHDVIALAHSAGQADQFQDVVQFRRFAAFCERAHARRGALVLLGSPNYQDNEVVIERRMIQESGRELFIVHL
jgi:predicted MPP superfamily phosphohydrolase